MGKQAEKRQNDT